MDLQVFLIRAVDQQAKQVRAQTLSIVVALAVLAGLALILVLVLLLQQMPKLTIN